MKHSGHDSIVKVMLYEAEEGIYLFGYTGLDSNRCSFDRCYDSLEDLYDDLDFSQQTIPGGPAAEISDKADEFRSAAAELDEAVDALSDMLIFRFK